MNIARNQYGRVGVLMGGRSAERAISLKSGRAILKALKRLGLNAVEIDLQDDWPQQIREADIQTAMLALHGWLGEDGCVQGLLEIMGIAYTGSGLRSASLCMHKRLSKFLLQQANLAVPADIPIQVNGPVRYPVVLKPLSQGSSIGLSFIDSPADWRSLNIEDTSDWMAEMPVSGVEIAVSVLNGKALPPVEIVPSSGIYDFDSKYTQGATEYFCPARLPAETLRHCLQRAERAVETLGCSGAPRVDMIVADGGEAYILEVNTIPGMTETSLLPKAAAAAGISFDHLCHHILESACLKSVETGSC